MQRIHLLSFLLTGVLGYCPPTGPVLPPPLIQDDFKLTDLSAALDTLAKGSAEFNSTTVSFSVSITSPNATFFEFHHTAPVKNNSGVAEVNSNTVYRVASNTKVFTTLATLLEFPDSMEDPIGKYIPELANDTRYDDITLRMLTSQVSGVPRDGNLFDRWSLVGKQLEQLGFPVPGPSDIPRCDVGAGSSPCSREEYFSVLAVDRMAWQAGDKAAYSDQAYMLLGFALEKLTGKPFQQVIKERIITPLGLESTTFVAPDPSKAIIPVGQGSVFYPLDISTYKATAGLYSTPSNMVTFLRGILTHKIFSPAKTRSWLKPSVFTSSFASAIGAPWEIFRAVSTSDKRPVDLYTKSGDIAGYSAWMILIPEYNVGVEVNAAGDGAFRATKAVLDLTANKLVPALEALAKQQAGAQYSGRYASTNGSDALTLKVDDGPGLRITNWTTKGQDVFKGLTVIKGDKNLEARIYPIGEENRWRMVLETPDAGPGLYESGCPQWMQVDQFRYAKLPLDEFDFEMDGDIVKSVTNLGLRSTMLKKAPASRKY